MTYLLEYWKPVVGYEGLYEVSNVGVIYSIRSKKRLIAHINHKGYYKITLCSEGEEKSVSVHRLVADAFIGQKNNHLTVNHKSGWKGNNSLSNLEYLSIKDNINHAIVKGLRSPGRIPGTGQKLKAWQVLEIINLKGTTSQRKLGAKYGVSDSTVAKFIRVKFGKAFCEAVR